MCLRIGKQRHFRRKDACSLKELEISAGPTCTKYLLPAPGSRRKISVDQWVERGLKNTPLILAFSSQASWWKMFEDQQKTLLYI